MIPFKRQESHFEREGYMFGFKHVEFQIFARIAKYNPN